MSRFCLDDAKPERDRVPELLAAIDAAKQAMASAQVRVNRLIIELEDYIARHAEPRVTEARRNGQD